MQQRSGASRERGSPVTHGAFSMGLRKPEKRDLFPPFGPVGTVFRLNSEELPAVVHFPLPVLQTLAT